VSRSTRRRKREGEVVCWCSAYGFPHRQLGGLCNGARYVADFFDKQMWGQCRDCHMRVEAEDEGYRKVECQALEGLEPPIMCPAMQEHVQYHGIKLYGVNKL
jgi:hypothetical protein